MSKIGDNIRKLRLDRGYTQEHIFELVGIRTSYLSQIESGARNPGRKTIDKLCELFAVEEEVLRYGERAIEKETPQVPEHVRRFMERSQERLTEEGITFEEQNLMITKAFEAFRQVRKN